MADFATELAIITFETRAVLAGAYKGKRLSLRTLHTHTVRLDDGRFAEVLYKTVELDSMADSEADDPNVPPTCPRCAKKDPRWKERATDGN